MRNLLRFAAVMALPIMVFVMMSCEGPKGPAGEDANATCTTCHTPDVVDRILVEFEFSKHSYGEAAFEEAGNTTCGPCHVQQAYLYVVENNIPATFTLNTTTGKYANDYVTISSEALGEIGCATCHSQLHTTYGEADAALTTTAPVAMTMWKGEKTINLTADGGRSNLCVRCHQPRPMTTNSTLSNGDVVDYDSLKTFPTTLFYDSTRTPVGAEIDRVRPSYRFHVHYGTVGAVFAGMGGVEFTGTESYTNSTHTTAASCQDCHMATVSGRAGGHTFMVQGNFNGCNQSGCHTSVSSSDGTFWTTPRANIKTLLNTLASELNALGGGHDILHSDSDSESNLWAGLTTGNYDGYLDIYDPSSNPSGYWQNPTVSSSWTTSQKQENYNKPMFPSLTNAHVGALINFQFCLRESSLGIHNYDYVHALLTNTIAILP